MDFLCEWTKNLAFYMIVVTIMIQMVPGEGYKKYIRFFVGLILILMLTQPVMEIFKLKDDFSEFYNEAKKQQEKMVKEWDVD